MNDKPCYYAYGVFCESNQYCYFIHYWVDDKMQYGEMITDKPQIPDITFATSGAYRIELKSPGNYTITTR